MAFVHKKQLQLTTPTICTITPANNLPQLSEMLQTCFLWVPWNLRDLLKNWCLLNLKFHFIKKKTLSYTGTPFSFVMSAQYQRLIQWLLIQWGVPPWIGPWQPLSHKHCLYSCTQMSTPWKIKCFDIIMKIASSAFLRIAALKCKKKGQEIREEYALGNWRGKYS